MNKIRLGVIYPMPKEYGVSIRINRLVSRLPQNFEIQEIVQRNWNDSLFGKIFYLIKQFLLIHNQNFNPDLIYGVAPLITGSMPSIYAKYVKKVPLIIDWDDSYLNFNIRTPRIWEIAYCEYLAVKRADSVVVVSSALFKNAVIARKSPKNIYYIPNGVDIKKYNEGNFNVKKIRKALRIPPDTIVITYIAHMGIFNGEFVGSELAKASLRLLKKHRNLLFLIIGYGKGMDLFKNFVKKNEIEEHYYFTGYVSNEKLPRYLAISDICVDAILNMNLESAFKKPFNLKNRSSMKLKEYMAMGRAIVSGNYGENIIDLDNGKAGLLIKHSHQSLEKALERLIFNNKLRRKLGKLAKIRARKCYNVENQAKDLEKVIFQLRTIEH